MKQNEMIIKYDIVYGLFNDGQAPYGKGQYESVCVTSICVTYLWWVQGNQG